MFFYDVILINLFHFLFSKWIGQVYGPKIFTLCIKYLFCNESISSDLSDGFQDVLVLHAEVGAGVLDVAGGPHHGDHPGDKPGRLLAGGGVQDIMRHKYISFLCS